MSFTREKINDYFLLDTSVENIFINEYMAGAPGDFIKVYLFALMYADLDVEITNEDIAKQLAMEHEDVLKAWNHWERMGAIRKTRKDSENKFDYDVEFVVLKEQLYGDKLPKPISTSDQSIQSFMSDNEIREMFDKIEKSTGRILGPVETKEILSWISDYNAAPSVIAYGYAYCERKKKKSPKYIGAVIKNWVQEGLADVESVEKHLSEADKKQHIYSRVFRALGFSRHATEAERRIMDTWFDDMGFTMEKVLEACSKTSGISNPNINYVNKVLVNQYEGKKTGKLTNDGSLTASEVMEYYELLRRREENEADEHRKEVYGKVPRIKEIEDEINANNAELSRIIISDRVDRQEAIDRVKKDVERLNTEKAFVMTDNGFEPDYMDIKHECTYCNDTGILETGERCQCFGEVTKTKLEMLKDRKTE